MKVKPKVGQHVMCKVAVEAYYSNYGLYKGRHIVFQPGMIGTVMAIAPKVCVPMRGAELPAHLDRKSDFAVVDYVDERGVTQRVGLNFCNVVVDFRCAEDTGDAECEPSSHSGGDAPRQNLSCFL